MKQFNFTKLSGAGNDFVLFDRKQNPELDLSAHSIKKICERRSGVGADGILVISDLDGCAFEMNYYNADGTTGSLCANGARCALLYGKVSGRLNNDIVNFYANGIQYSGIVLDERRVKFFLNPSKNLKRNFKIKAANQLITASFLDTGSPQVVIKIQDVLKNSADPNSFYKNLDAVPVYELGKEIRYHRDFAPEGTNVNFIDIKEDVIKIRSYERGVEEETLSCGTGSVASAIVTYMNEKRKPPIKLLAKSGNELVVDFKIVNQIVQELSLTGPAEIIFNGEISI